MLTKTRLGTNEDGSPLHHYTSEDPENLHVVIVGPHYSGMAYAADGTAYDCTENVIQVESQVHAVEVANAIGSYFEENGHPLHDDEVPFVVEPLSLPEITMALASAAAENAALNGLDGTGSTNTIPDVSLHSASPSTTGANENANSGSYARQSCSWNAASGGTKTNSSSLTFSTLGTVAVTHFGTWSSAVYGAGTYSIGGSFGSSVTAASITIAAGAISLSAS